MGNRNPELRAAVQRLCGELQYSTRRASEELGVSERAIQRHRVALGISGQVHVNLSDELLHRIELMVEDGCPFNEIARTFGVSAKVIQHRFKGRGSGENLADCRQLRIKMGLTWNMVGES